MLWLLASLTSLSQAHGYIVRSIPEDRSTLQRPPARLQYWFSEDLEPRFSSLNLRDQSGAILATGGVDADNQARMTLSVPSDLPDGAYVVELRPAFAADGHVVAQTQVFFVGESVAGVESLAASQNAQGLEVLWKALLLSGTYTLFGVLVLYRFVLVPVWGSPRYPMGLLPPRVMRRLNLIVGLAWGVALAGNVLALLQQTMVFFDVDASTALSAGLWQIVRTGSRFGDVWSFRLLGLLVVGAGFLASLYFRQQYPRTVQSFWTANMWAMALILGAAAVNSHAAGALVMPWVAISIHWLHALSVAFWIGGLLALVLVLPSALAPLSPPEQAGARLAILRRFSKWVYGCAWVTLFSGMYSASNWFYSPQDFVSNYGTTLGLKLLMVGALLMFALAHHMALHPQGRLARLFAPLQARLSGAVQGFGISLRLEALLGVVLVMWAGALSATPIPQPTFLQDSRPAPIAQAPVGEARLTATLIPGAPGVNSLDMVLEGATDETPPIRLQWVNPQTGARGAWLNADPLEAGVFVATSADINSAGTWQALIDIGTGTQAQRVVLELNASEDAAVLRTLPPTVWNLVPAFWVLVGIALVLQDWGQRLWARLNLAPQTLLMAGGMTLISLVFIGVSIQWVAEQDRQSNALLRPVPMLINPVLPDAASLARGEVLYQDHCIVWQSVTDFRALVGNAERLSDEELFRATLEGWRKVPACAGELSEAQRWDIVNYFRRFAYAFQAGASS